MSSIIEIRRADVRWGDEEYQILQKKLKRFIKEAESEFGEMKDFLSFRWMVTETVLHDEEAECVPDDYPVLLVEVQLIFKKELWVKSRFQYEIVVDQHSFYFFKLGKVNNATAPCLERLPFMIAEALK